MVKERACRQRSSPDCVNNFIQLLLNGLVVCFSVSKRRYCFLTKAIKTVALVLDCAALACVSGRVPRRRSVCSQIQFYLAPQFASRQQENRSCITFWILKNSTRPQLVLKSPMVSDAPERLTFPGGLWTLSDAILRCFIRLWPNVPSDSALKALLHRPQSRRSARIRQLDTFSSVFVGRLFV